MRPASRSPSSSSFVRRRTKAWWQSSLYRDSPRGPARLSITALLPPAKRALGAGLGDDSDRYKVRTLFGHARPPHESAHFARPEAVLSLPQHGKCWWEQHGAGLGGKGAKLGRRSGDDPAT
jgi:hypothetical protein